MILITAVTFVCFELLSCLPHFRRAMTNFRPKWLWWRKQALQMDFTHFPDLMDGHHRECLFVRLLTLVQANEKDFSKNSWKSQLTKAADSNISVTPAMSFILQRDKNTDLDYRKSLGKYAMNIHSWLDPHLPLDGGKWWCFHHFQLTIWW